MQGEVPGLGAARHALGLVDVHGGGLGHAPGEPGAQHSPCWRRQAGKGQGSTWGPVRGRLLPPSAGCGQCRAATAGSRAGLLLLGLQQQGCTSVRQANTQKHPRTVHERDKLLVGDASSVPLSRPCHSLLISHLAMKFWTALKFYIPISCENLTFQRCRGSGTVPSSPSSLLGFGPLSPDFVKGPGGFLHPWIYSYKLVKTGDR